MRTKWSIGRVVILAWSTFLEFGGENKISYVFTEIPVYADIFGVDVLG